MDRIDCLVIGAGVVGLACARALALAGREVLVIERALQIGTGISARNSEVIHAGIYYPSGSLKARLCVRGRALLYAYCAERGIGHRRCGKLVVATRAQEVAQLAAMQQHALAEGVDDLRLLSRAEALALEPELDCVAALLSPSTGIVDSHGLMTALLGDAEQAGAQLVLGTQFCRAERAGEAWRVLTRSAGEGHGHGDGDGAEFEIEARCLVNAAGLDAQRVATQMQGMTAAAMAPQWRAKGHYFSLSGRAPFQHLIYPLPVDGGLGVHLTLDLGGQARFGPDVEWLSADAPLDYAVDARRAASFEVEICRYWPGLQDRLDLPNGGLSPAYTGIRPKLSGPGQPAADFRIDGPTRHGLPGVVQLFGIESPGLTASMAIAQVVLGQL